MLWDEFSENFGTSAGFPEFFIRRITKNRLKTNVTVTNHMYDKFGSLYIREAVGVCVLCETIFLHCVCDKNTGAV